jgi:hypothetical protein
LISKSDATWHTGFSCFCASATASALNSFGYTRRSLSFFPVVFSASVVFFAYLCVYQMGQGPMFFYHMQAALRYAVHETWREFSLFVRGEDFIDDDGGKLRIPGRHCGFLTQTIKLYIFELFLGV